MTIQIADHFGMCFGVRDALSATTEEASKDKITVLGQLVHNPVVSEKLESLGVEQGDLENTDSSSTKQVVITAHGASGKDKAQWRQAGFTVTDTTCPLVKKAHNALARLVLDGYFPVVIGRADHVEVRGLTGDFPDAVVILNEEDISLIPARAKIGVISQTTQPIERVQSLVDKIEAIYQKSEVKFVDTVCQPTKNRQLALRKLCIDNELVVVVGGHNSNNTHQLVDKARSFGTTAYHVATPSELRAEWFLNVNKVGITAGTSTLHETVYAVREQIEIMVSGT